MKTGTWNVIKDAAQHRTAAQVAEETGLSVGTVRRYLAEMVKRREMPVSRGPRGAVLYGADRSRLLTPENRVRVTGPEGVDEAVREERWTAFIGWDRQGGPYPGAAQYAEAEEIDLDVYQGTPEAEIRAFAQKVVEEEYMPGGTVFSLVRRFGMYL